MILGMSLVLLFLACGANEGACGHRYNWLQLVSFFRYSWRRIRSSHKAPGSDTVFGNGDIICLAGASLDRSSSHDISSALRSSPRVRDFSSAAADLARKMSSPLMIRVTAQKGQKRYDQWIWGERIEVIEATMLLRKQWVLCLKISETTVCCVSTLEGSKFSIASKSRSSCT